MPPSEPSSTIRAVDSTQVAQADDFRARVAAISEPETKPLPVDGSVAQSMMPSGEATSAQDPPAECSASGTTIDELAQSITTAPPLHPQAPPTQAATTLCRYWAEGYCFRGALCWYKHSRDPASTSFAPPTAADALGPAAAAAQGDSTGPKSPKSPTAASLNAQASAFSPATTTLAADQVAEQIAQLAQEGPASDQKDGQTEETSGQVASDVPAPERQPGPSVLPEQPACMICYEMPATYGLLGECGGGVSRTSGPEVANAVCRLLTIHVDFDAIPVLQTVAVIRSAFRASANGVKAKTHKLPMSSRASTSAVRCAGAPVSSSPLPPSST